MIRFSYAEAMCDPSYYVPLAREIEAAGYDAFVVPDDQEAVTLTVDGSGDQHCTVLWECRGERIRRGAGAGAENRREPQNAKLLPEAFHTPSRESAEGSAADLRC